MPSLTDQIEHLAQTAGEEPSSLWWRQLDAEELNESLALELVLLIQDLSSVCMPEERQQAQRTLLAFHQVFRAIIMYRQVPHEHRHQPEYWFSKLLGANGKELRKLLDSIKENAELSTILRGDLWSGAVSAGVLDWRKCGGPYQAEIISDTGGMLQCDAEFEWLELLSYEKAALKKSITKAREKIKANSPKKLDLVSRFKLIAGDPTKRKLRKLIADATKEESLTLETLASMLKYASLGKDIDTPDQTDDKFYDFEALIQQLDESDIGQLSETIVKQFGRSEPLYHALHQFADRVARIYEDLVGHYPRYATATDSALRREPGERYGHGLEFLRLSLQLVDPSATTGSARAHIDRQRKELKLFGHLMPDFIWTAAPIEFVQEISGLFRLSNLAVEDGHDTEPKPKPEPKSA